MPLTLPNLITGVRLLLVPAVVAALAQQAYAWALAGFLVAGISDAADGILARALHQHTRVGAVLDALADKLIIFSTIGMLALAGALPLWVSALLVGRDALIVLGIALYRRRVGEVEIAPLFLGKLHVFVVFALLTVVLAHMAGVGDHSRWLAWLFVLATATSVGSVLLYAVVWGRKACAVASP